jgi:ATP-dependent Lhr-like helicase
VLIDGAPIVYLERSHKGLLTFPAAADEELLRAAVMALAVDRQALGSRGLSIERIDGGPAIESRVAGFLRDAGFVQGFRGLTRRPERAEAMAHA